MNRRMRDEEFEALLGDALREQVAPAGLRERIHNSSRSRRTHWLAVLLSPMRIAACAGIVSLALGFALGVDNAAVAGDTNTEMAVALYAANDIGDL
jgi:hypothetical protein